MENKELSIALKNELEIDFSENSSLEDLKERLANYINQLIDRDFQKLVVLLYRIDVSENKLRSLLTENPSTDAGRMIAELIIERQLQKIKTRKEFKSKENNSEEERW